MSIKQTMLVLMIVLITGIPSYALVDRIIGFGAHVVITGVADGTCLNNDYELVREGGVQIIPTTIGPMDSDIDTTTGNVWAVLNRDPLNGAAVIPNLFEIATSGMTISKSISVLIHGDPTYFFCDRNSPRFNSCVNPSTVRVDVANNYAYVGGKGFIPNNEKSLGTVKLSTGSVDNISFFNYGSSTNVDSVIAFSESVATYHFGTVRSSDNPTTYAMRGIEKGITPNVLAGPTNVTLNTGINSDIVLRGGVVLDPSNGSLFMLDIKTSATATLLLRRYDSTFTEIESRDIAVDVPGVSGATNAPIVWDSVNSELYVCTGNWTLVYGMYPITLKRSANSSCVAPQYDYINDKLYVIRSNAIHRLNPGTLASEANIAVSGIVANRMPLDVERQKIYPVTISGIISGIAVNKYSTCGTPSS